MHLTETNGIHLTLTQNFYAICEIAQELIKARAHQNLWSIQSYPGKVKLPPDILRPLPNAETANKVCDGHAFIPSGLTFARL